MRAAATLHSEDDDFGQAGTLYREVFDAEQRARFLETLTGQGRSITIDAIRERFFQYWTNVDADLAAPRCVRASDPHDHLIGWVT